MIKLLDEKNNRTGLLVCIALIILAVLTNRRCNDTDYVVTSDTTYVHDTVTYVDTLPVPVPYAVTEVESVPKYIPDIECVELYKNYYASAMYVDTLKNDSLALIVLHDTVHKNRLTGRTLYYKDRTPTQIITYTYSPAEVQRNRYYIGILTGGGKNYFGIGPSVLMQRRTVAYGYTYDITNKQHYLSFYYSIIKGKRGN